MPAITFNAPLFIASGGDVGITQASGSTNGFLSSTDWNTFNNKQPAGNYVTTDTSQTITASKSFTQGFNLASEGGTNQLSVFRNTSSLHTGSAGSNIFGFNSANNIYFGKGLNNGGVLQWNNTTLTRYYTLPDADGTIALTSNLGAYLPLAGGTLTGALGGTSLNFSGDIQTATRLISATGGQQILINANNGGSTNRVESVGTLPLALVSAAAITLAAGGTTPQITLATTGAVTLTGALNGTSATMSGLVTGGTGLRATGGTDAGSQLSLFANGSGNTFIAGFDINFNTGSNNARATCLTLASTGAATFSSSVTATQGIFSGSDAERVRLTRTSIGSWTLGISATNRFSIYDVTADAERISITSAGNVGIGTASPSRTLDVNGGARANNFASIKDRVSVPSSTFTTFFTPSLSGLYLARVYLSGNNSQFWSAVIMFEFNASTILVVNQTNGINVSTNVSGTNIQVRQIGGSTFDFDFEIIRIG
jgi:hypothetical protein